MEIIKVGDKAPLFALIDQNGNNIKLSQFIGKKVLLSFHPLAWTSVCSIQMQSLEKNYDRFNKLNTVPLGISIDSQPSKEAWSKNLRINRTRLLADFWAHGDLAKKLGIFDEKTGVSKRANILIDETGIVKWIKVYPNKEIPDTEEMFNFLSGDN